MQLAAPRPQTGYKPVIGVGNPNLHPDWAASGHHAVDFSPVKDALLNVLTLGEHDHPGDLRAYGHELRQSFDPETPQGALNWAAMFVPGARGGFKQVGPLTERQAAMLDHLHSVRGGGEFSLAWKQKTQQSLIDGGVHPDVAADMVERMAQRYRAPYRMHDVLTSHAPPTHPSLGDLSDLAKIMGVPRGNPLYELKHNVGHNEARAGSKLGTGTGGEVPSWVNTKDDLSLWKLYGHDPSHQAALEGMSDDQRLVLSQILDTINRRAPKADPNTSQLGSWMSGGAKGPLNARGAALHRDLHALIEQMNVHAAPPYKDTVGAFVTQLRNALDQGHYEFVRKMLSSNAVQWGNVAGQVHFPAMDKLEELSAHGHDPVAPDPRNN